ncbi:2OG-Fe(II) oxygenase [Exophiala viscosa]|uniref:2OG-Fe(II) oxygenase n=1 Tax=Exophiala viscosa TaxID=2486360 RepID=A0AAN6IA46_9EURO|nr:2OG-Fe(II) oxygenase [Exophiala viscosa]
MSTIMAKGAFEIPLVDFSRYLHGSEHDQKACVEEIMKGFTTSGFVYLQNSGLDPATAFQWAEEYFALSPDEKRKYPNVDPKANRGYSGMGVEKVTNADLTNEEDIEELRKIFPDIKESLELGSETSYGYPEKGSTNHLPEDTLPGISDGIMTFFTQCDKLQKQLMSAIATGLGLDKTYFLPHISAGDHCLRLLHYPSVPKSVLTAEGAVRAGAHTDYGTVTLLFQDGSGGLQARTPSGEYVDVPPIPGAIVINAGDLLQIWTNDVIKSTFHRVVSPPDAKTTEDGDFSARYSIAFFSHPDHDKLVSAIEACVTESRPKKYEPVMPIDWMVKRLQATY